MHPPQELGFAPFGAGDPLDEFTRTRQGQYVRRYLDDLGAKSILIEPTYFDRDYLAEFAAFYCTSSAGYPNICRRFHFCRCDCGAEREAMLSHLRRGATVSCGCKRRTHNESAGASRSPEYRTWLNVLQRCRNSNNPGYSLYGGRGVRIDERWAHSYEAFLADVGRKPSPLHSIDRIDPNGNYEPGNVRWATAKEQGRNRRKSVLPATGAILLRQIYKRRRCYSITIEDIAHAFGMTPGSARNVAGGWSGYNSSRLLDELTKLA